ncbi:hypothetical protein HAX54_039051 [Datura stramonium]|uniref:Uncharacterized protein n=1 Tax=Datura stramonium TaxID=4076 RepID=A0ABS8SIK7_DATST|nr:hypothetical protein [Datura stramonium]
MSNNEQMKLISLKDLQPPLSPSKLIKQRYVKIKEVKLINGVRIYWELKTTSQHKKEKAEDALMERVSCEGFFEFVSENIIQHMRRWVDDVFGPILNLPTV